jgi:multiple antibiotic resistance protein
VSGIDFYLQAIVSVLVITDPITRGILFKAMTAAEPERRAEYVRKITITVGITLGIAAVAGKQILDLLGINLGAFGFAGGLVVALMGFEMLFGGQPSRAQGGKEAHEGAESFEGSVIVPYAIPFVAGPGAMTLVITIASSGSGAEGPIAALVAVAVAVLLLPVGHLYLANKLNLSESAMGIFTKFGGLLVATIGIQLMLNGLVTFFGLNIDLG